MPVHIQMTRKRREHSFPSLTLFGQNLPRKNVSENKDPLFQGLAYLALNTDFSLREPDPLGVYAQSAS